MSKSERKIVRVTEKYMSQCYSHIIGFTDTFMNVSNSVMTVNRIFGRKRIIKQKQEQNVNKKNTESFEFK